MFGLYFGALVLSGLVLLIVLAGAFAYKVLSRNHREDGRNQADLHDQPLDDLHPVHSGKSHVGGCKFDQEEVRRTRHLVTPAIDLSNLPARDPRIEKKLACVNADEVSDILAGLSGEKQVYIGDRYIGLPSRSSHGEGVWQGAIADGWDTPRGPLGGYVMAILMRGLELAVADDERQARSVTMHFLRVPESGPVTVSSELEREGRLEYRADEARPDDVGATGDTISRAEEIFRRGAEAYRILLDPEARGEVKTDPNYGKLREPMQYATNFLRAFGVRNAAGTGESDGVIFKRGEFTGMAQIPFRSPTVFNYYPPDFVVPGTALLGPEFALMTTGTSISRANFINRFVFTSIPVAVSTDAPQGTSLDFSDLQAISAADSTGNLLVDELNRRLLYGTMTAAMRTQVLNAVTAVSSTDTLGRVRQAVYLIGTSSQYQVQR